MQVNKKLVLTLFLGFLSLMLVVGMVAPYFSGGGGALSLAGQRGTPVLRVNGQNVTAEELELIRRSVPILNTVPEGPLADDFRIVTAERGIQNALLLDDARGISVPRQDVLNELGTLREQLGITADADYRNWLTGQGLSDHELRGELEKQLRVNRRIEQLREELPPVTDEQARTFYELNAQFYQTEPRVRARAIVTADRAQAEALRAQALAGADFAALAGQFSEVNREQGGAVGAVQDGRLAAVGSAAFVDPVSSEVFARTGPGLTEVIEDGGRFYLVNVEEVLPPAPRPFEEVRAEVNEAVEAALLNGRLERWLDELRAGAQIETLDPAWAYDNPPVANVAGQPIRYSELLGQVVTNPNFEQLLTQIPGDASSFVNSFFKPEFLNNLILQYAAPTIARNNNLNIPGSRAEVLGGLYAWAGSRVTVTDEDVRAAFEAQRDQYGTPGSAEVTVVTFNTPQQANAFIQSFSRQPQNLIRSAAAAGGTVSDQGPVQQGDQALAPEQEEVLFGRALSPAGEGSLTVPVQLGGFTQVLYVTDFVPANQPDFAEVQETVRESVLAERRDSEAQAFLERELERIPVQNTLDEALAAQQRRLGIDPEAEGAALPDFQVAPATPEGAAPTTP